MHEIYQSAVGKPVLSVGMVQSLVDILGTEAALEASEPVVTAGLHQCTPVDTADMQLMRSVQAVGMHQSLQPPEGNWASALRNLLPTQTQCVVYAASTILRLNCGLAQSQSNAHRSVKMIVNK